MIHDDQVRERLSLLDDTHLLRVVNEDSDDYTDRAVEIALELLAARGIVAERGRESETDKLARARRLDSEAADQSGLGWIVAGLGLIFGLGHGGPIFYAACFLGFSMIGRASSKRSRALALRYQVQVVRTRRREQAAGLLSPVVDDGGLSLPPQASLGGSRPLLRAETPKPS